MDTRKQLTALRKELKSAGKEKRKEIQALISELEISKNSGDGAVLAPPAVEEVPEKAQNARNKRREKEESDRLERDRIISEAKERVLAGPQLDVIERETLGSLLSTNSLCVHHIPADGNCLFTAISHQLSLHNKEVSFQKLRTMASQHIAAHPDKYSGFMDYAELHVNSVSEYCALVETPGWWGGDLEIEAISSELGVSITVYKADGPIVFNDQCTQARLRISYHRHLYALGAHYNSLIKSN